MCIVFLFCNNDPAPGEYQVIIAVNRDEFFKRPTQPADFWNGHCISGLDLQTGREGGTWFGTSATSKTGALLNILEPVTSGDKVARGHLVTNYLTGTDDAATYIKRIAATRDCYNAFNLVLLEKRNNEWMVYYCSTEDDNVPREMPAGLYVFGNSVYDQPWQKVVHGKKKFQEIVTSFNSVSKEAELKEAVLDLLTDKTSYLPDPQMASQSPKVMLSEEIMSARSAVFVDLAKKFQYGTRTHTLLLIDDIGHCQYVERTMSDFTDANNPVWKTVTHTYQLNHCNGIPDI